MEALQAPFAGQLETVSASVFPALCLCSTGDNSIHAKPSTDYPQSPRGSVPPQVTHKKTYTGAEPPFIQQYSTWK